MRATILENPWIPHEPTPKQAEFLLMPDLEVLFGGSAGGGKSDALLMAALQYVDVPGYAAILFRRTYTDLSLPGALMDRAHEWLQGTKADELKLGRLVPKLVPLIFQVTKAQGCS